MASGTKGIEDFVIDELSPNSEELWYIKSSVNKMKLGENQRILIRMNEWTSVTLYTLLQYSEHRVGWNTHTVS